MYGFPDIEGFYDMLYGTAGVDFGGATCFQFGAAASLVFPGNPPYTVTDFIGIYPKFAGPATSFTGLTITQGSNVISGFNATTIAGFQVGQLVVNLNSIQKDSLVTAYDPIGLTVTISNPALANDVGMTVYQNPVMPIMVILSYVCLAQVSISQQRYHAAWFMAMSYFVAHYCTLFMRTDSGDPSYTASSVASSGLSKGIIVQRTAGDVSATSKLIEGYEEWGAWTETQYGELFITLARAINCGPIFVG